MGRRPSSSSLASLSTASLQAEMRRRARVGSGLLRKRAKLAAKLAALDAQIRTAGIAGGGSTGRVRPQNKSNLADALAAVLKGKTMGVTEVAEAVRKAGYNTNAANFRTIVNQCLIKHRNLFKKVERGQYTAA